MREIVDVYIDGSFIQDKARWGLIAVRDNKAIFQECGELEGEINSMRQIGGELKASIQAIAYARRTGVKARIFYDYIGIYNWVRDLFSFQNPWQTNNEWTAKYREFVSKNREHVYGYEKVKAHDGNFWNEAVDKLARTNKYE